ncbi:hypothetical protein L596_003866 [Steinernema carpocapsae]|uniref:Uncharacterized protein n=1 Tax=Steinernema carpocapsae TaxID=34508 RepID=A0A4U8UV00_STECR|nr:hypothetical protein L596_003866 [Steinernema carpocapsae]
MSSARFLGALCVTVLTVLVLASPSEPCFKPCEREYAQQPKRSAWKEVTELGEDRPALKRKLAASSRFWVGKRAAEKSGKDVSEKLAKSLRFWGKRSEGMDQQYQQFVESWPWKHYNPYMEAFWPT